MKDFFEDFRTALNEIATTFLFFIPNAYKKEKEIAKKISKNKLRAMSLFWHGSFII